MPPLTVTFPVCVAMTLLIVCRELLFEFLSVKSKAPVIAPVLVRLKPPPLPAPMVVAPVSVIRPLKDAEVVIDELVKAPGLSPLR